MLLPARQCALGRAVPLRVSGDTKVASTATCAPPHTSRPETTTSSRLSSLTVASSVFKFFRKQFVRTLPPASRPTLAQALSSGTALVCKTPTVLQAARWSRRVSMCPPHLHLLQSRSKGSRNLLSSRILSFALLHRSSSFSGSRVRCSPAQRPDCERSKA